MKICEICNKTKEDDQFRTLRHEVTYKLNGKPQKDEEKTENVCINMECMITWKKETQLIMWKVIAMKTQEPTKSETYTLEEVCGIVNMLLVSQGAPPVEDDTMFEEAVGQLHKAWKILRGRT